MSQLPVRPDLDQLRRQARELHRAALGGNADALRRVRRVSGNVGLSAAQLAIAREYGFASWPQLRAEVERRRAQAVTDVGENEGLAREDRADEVSATVAEPGPVPRRQAQARRHRSAPGRGSPAPPAPAGRTNPADRPAREPGLRPRAPSGPHLVGRGRIVWMGSSLACRPVPSSRYWGQVLLRREAAGDVRAVYRPGAAGDCAGPRRSQDAQSQLHRHRAHPARPRP